MQQLRTFPYIPLKVPRYKILKRLGYQRRQNEISQRMMSEVDDWISHAADRIRLKATACIKDIQIDHGKGTVALKQSDTVFKSDKFTRFLGEADQLLIMGITAGQAVADEIRQLQEDKRMTGAVIVDAAASEIVDEGFDWLMALYNKELIRERRALKLKRFSAGYGDFDIRFQADIYNMLKMETLGVSMTQTFILTPEKSVTAFCGISKVTGE
ncbi:hypothetical protein [uncultured Desulfobacter sp.]|uniref:hypothetical protein n=1 Tax=uncultured Desulfobacter sp. TaxID=240139 RepID=UPI002AAB5430|nr:hypothetical protein [uncultured Desulfobacter sp.]